MSYTKFVTSYFSSQLTVSAQMLLHVQKCRERADRQKTIWANEGLIKLPAPTMKPTSSAWSLYDSYSLMGWCMSDLDYEIQNVDSPDACWTQCYDMFGATLVAIDWEDNYCYCQDSCACRADVGSPSIQLLVHKDFALPSEECACYEGCASCDGPGEFDCSECSDGSKVVDDDGDGYGACISGDTVF